MRKFRTQVLFDMRAPAFGAPAPDLYSAALDMASFSDEIGVSSILAMEHHGCDDGYLPAPFVLGAAIAGRTNKCRIMLSAVVLPLHDPVKIAEQIAVLDLISGGRLQVIVAAGYVPSEFAMFKVAMQDRGRLLDSGLEIILRALDGERFVADEREIYVRPLPIQNPRDIVIVGGGVEASARRAARFGLGFSPMQERLLEVFEDECRRLGKKPGFRQGGSGPISIHLSTDPEAAWRALMPHLKHTVREYARWAAIGVDSPFLGLEDNEQAIRDSGLFVVFTPDQLLAAAPSMVGEFGSLRFMPLIGGLEPEIGWEGLKLLEEVMPRLGGNAGARAE